MILNVKATSSAGSRTSGVRKALVRIGYQVIRPNGFTELEAKYAFQMDDGAIVYIENIGVRFGPKEALDRIARGDVTRYVAAGNPGHLTLPKKYADHVAPRYRDRLVTY